jgi:hypothetical protein
VVLQLHHHRGRECIGRWREARSDCLGGRYVVFTQIHIYLNPLNYFLLTTSSPTLHKSTFPIPNPSNDFLSWEYRHGHRRPLHRRINLRHPIRRKFTKLALRRAEHIHRPTPLCRKAVSANPKLHVSFVYPDRRCGSLSLHRTCNSLPYSLSRNPKVVYICANVMIGRHRIPLRQMGPMETRPRILPQFHRL